MAAEGGEVLPGGPQRVNEFSSLGSFAEPMYARKFPGESSLRLELNFFGTSDSPVQSVDT